MEMVAKHLESFPIQEQSATRRHTAIQIKQPLLSVLVSFSKRVKHHAHTHAHIHARARIHTAGYWLVQQRARKRYRVDAIGSKEVDYYIACLFLIPPFLQIIHG